MLTPSTSASTAATSDVLTMKKTAAAARIAGRSSGAKWNWPSRGTSVSRPSTRAAASTAIEYCAMLNAILCAGLRRIRSAMRLASSSPASATSAPPAISIANANVVDVVVSPSEPRV